MFDEPGRPSTMVYILASIVVLMAVLMLANTKFQFLPSYFYFRSEKTKVLSKSRLYWDPKKIYRQTGHMIKADEAPLSMSNDRYALMFDTVWYNTRSLDGNGPYRHILHRGSDELKSIVDTSALAIFGSSTGLRTPSCNSGRYGPLPNKGLPKYMNPGIFADPVLNDIWIFIDTQRGSEFLRESIRIPDIPMDIPFRLAVVVQDQYVEAYINCRLEVTKVLKGQPISVSKEWYGLSGKAPLKGQVQNLRLWEVPLAADEIYNMCPPIPSFGPPQQCPDDTCTLSCDKQSPAATPPAAPAPKIGYGRMLAKCL